MRSAWLSATARRCSRAGRRRSGARWSSRAECRTPASRSASSPRSSIPTWRWLRWRGCGASGTSYPAARSRCCGATWTGPPAAPRAGQAAAERLTLTTAEAAGGDLVAELGFLSAYVCNGGNAPAHRVCAEADLALRLDRKAAGAPHREAEGIARIRLVGIRAADRAGIGHPAEQRARVTRVGRAEALLQAKGLRREAGLGGDPRFQRDFPQTRRHVGGQAGGAKCRCLKSGQDCELRAHAGSSCGEAD